MLNCWQQNISLAGKRVLIRQDLNVPIHQGVIQSHARIEAALPTIEAVLASGAGVILLSHLGRPDPSDPKPQDSLAPVADYLAQRLSAPLRFVVDWIDGVTPSPGEVVLCENVRLLPGEMNNSVVLAQKMAALCDVFIMDAFATAHRQQSSTHGVAVYAKAAYAGPLLSQEIAMIEQSWDQGQSPKLAVVGGAKVSSKGQLLARLIQSVDRLIVGGGIANTFLKAAGFEVGQSLYEPDLVDTAKAIMDQADQRGMRFPLPVDVVVAPSLDEGVIGQVCAVDAVPEDMKIFDIGPKTMQHYQEVLVDVGTVLWNGPLGVFEHPAFAQGTRWLAESLANSPAHCCAGGGDTVAAIEAFSVGERIDYISTGGGAFLALIESGELAALAPLYQQEHAHNG